MSQRYPTRRSFLRSTAAAGSVIAVAPLLPSGAFAAAQNIVFITPWKYLVGFAPTINADVGGHFGKNGLQSKILGGNGAAMAVQQVLSGGAHIGRASSIDIVKAVGNKGAPLLTIATIKKTSPFFVTSHKDKPINSPKDMVGKVIGVTSSGGGTENLLDMMLEKNGIPHKSVERQVVGNAPGAFDLINKGRIACYMPSTGTVLRLKGSGQPIHTWNTDDQVAMPGQVYFATTDWLKNNSEAAVGFLRAVRASIQEMHNSEMGSIIDRMGKSYDIIGIKNRDFSILVGETELKTFGSGADTLRNDSSRWNSVTKGMISAGLSKSVDASKLYTNRYVDQI